MQARRKAARTSERGALLPAREMGPSLAPLPSAAPVALVVPLPHHSGLAAGGVVGVAGVSVWAAVSTVRLVHSGGARLARFDCAGTKESCRPRIYNSAMHTHPGQSGCQWC